MVDCESPRYQELRNATLQAVQTSELAVSDEGKAGCRYPEVKHMQYIPYRASLVAKNSLSCCNHGNILPYRLGRFQSILCSERCRAQYKSVATACRRTSLANQRGLREPDILYTGHNLPMVSRRCGATFGLSPYLTDEQGLISRRRGKIQSLSERLSDWAHM